MSLRRIVCLAPLGMFVLATASAQMPGASVNQSAARAKLRPIGSPGLVDQLRQTPVPQGYGSSQQQSFSSADQQAVAKPVIQQTAMMQATGGMGLPPLGAPPPAAAQPSVAQPPAATMPTGPSTPLPGAPSSRPVPPSLAGQGLQPVPLDNQPLPNNQALPTAPQGVPAGNDLTPVPQPGLSQNMATVDNCACVSAPSTYNAGGMWDCGPAYVVPTSATVPASVPYAPPPAVIAPPVASPAVVPTAMVPTAGCKPLFTLGQDPYNVQLGQGIIGQPKAYVPGQSVRNFIRYFTP
ncbi:hypothetical protein [Roseimaritima ulvae]|uniref:IgA FC receptor n=1 Tax=Roseimaritima ulvae TaxID=980254 RepID=A0A5B9QWC2_9BACT|nr:hypothetical protein [Roseimaritima ulvae]QEG43307.1 hypothetical protein UC8_53540 [Roseimaritima ulvae]